MVAVEKNEDHENHGDANGQEGMQQGRDKGNDAGEVRSTLHTDDLPFRWSIAHTDIVGERGDKRHETAYGSAALREIANVLDLAMKVGLIARQAARDLGELGGDDDGKKRRDQ
jgi:hypothetical protein